MDIRVVRNLGTVVAVVAALACSIAPTAHADPITGGPTGLATPSSTITFDELGNLQDQVITNQFAAYGATFSGFGWDDALTGQGGSTGFAGGDLVNGFGFPTGPMVISFSQAMSAAAFAAVDLGSTFLLESFLGGVSGTLVESFSISIDFYPGAGFIGFENSYFDAIRISNSSGSPLSIDTLQMEQAAAIPEPATLTLVGLGALGALARRRRKRTQNA